MLAKNQRIRYINKCNALKNIQKLRNVIENIERNNRSTSSFRRIIARTEK
jgi:hypothetical protein